MLNIDFHRQGANLNKVEVLLNRELNLEEVTTAIDLLEFHQMPPEEVARMLDQ